MPIHRLTPDTMWDMYNTAHHTVRAGNTVYISGQVAVDERSNNVGIGDVEAQIAQIYKNLENACRAHGARFDLKTGQVLRGPARKPVRTYPVYHCGETIEVEID